MKESDRPDPDVLLAAITRQEKSERNGRLKIFFGMCPGVGKTYAMLTAAKERLKQGDDIVVGYVESHGRLETMSLVDGLPVLDRAKVHYKGTILEEMDLDAILARRPSIVVVDELAHTNAPGSRHAKRYQDVIEILESGIDVFTTLNVQHVESRKDTISQITGIEIRETVPDSLLDLSSDLTVIDLTPEKLRERLAEGKVYAAGRAQAASDHFFKESNLIALREMALRLVAERVERDLRQARLQSGTPWKAADRLMVPVIPSPSAEKLIRWTRRTASSLEASWIAVTVETPRGFSEEEQRHLTKNLALARSLGAEVIMTQGVSTRDTLMRVAREQNVSQIILKKPSPHRLWKRLFSPALSWWLSNSGDVDIQFVEIKKGSREQFTPGIHSYQESLLQYGKALAVAAAVTLLCTALEPEIGYQAVSLLYLLGVLFAALRLSRFATIFLAFVSAATWDFLFTVPKYTFYISKPEDVLMLVLLFTSAIIIGNLTNRLRIREEMERVGGERVKTILRFTQALSACNNVASIRSAALAKIEEIFQTRVSILLADTNGNLPEDQGDAAGLILSEKELGVANWVFANKRPAGRFTETLADSHALHLPILSGTRIMGVLSVALETPISLQQREILETLVSQLALVLEKA